MIYLKSPRFFLKKLSINIFACPIITVNGFVFGILFDWCFCVIHAKCIAHMYAQDFVVRLNALNPYLFAEKLWKEIIYELWSPLHY